MIREGRRRITSENKRAFFIPLTSLEPIIMPIHFLHFILATLVCLFKSRCIYPVQSVHVTDGYFHINSVSTCTSRQDPPVGARNAFDTV